MSLIKRDFVTLYFVAAGARPVTFDEIARGISSLRGTFVRDPVRVAVQSLPATFRVASVGTGADAVWVVSVAAGPFAGIEITAMAGASEADVRALISRWTGTKIVTGIKAHMRLTNPATTDAQIAAQKSTIRESLYAPMRAAGFEVWGFNMVRAGSTIPGDRGIPPTPVIPGVLDALIALATGTAMVAGAIKMAKNSSL